MMRMETRIKRRGIGWMGSRGGWSMGMMKGAMTADEEGEKPLEETMKRERGVLLSLLPSSSHLLASMNMSGLLLERLRF